MEVAQEAAATLVVDHLSKVLGAPTLHKSALIQAVIPFYGVNWNRKILTAITTNRLNHELNRLKRADFPAKEYERLADFLLMAYQAHGFFPPGTEEWQMLAERFRIDASHEWDEIAAVIPFLEGRGFISPPQLSDVQPVALEALCKDGQSPLLIRSFWSVARSTYCVAASSAFTLPEHKSYTGTHLLRTIKKHAKQAAYGRKLSTRLSPRLRKIKAFEKMGPAQKIRKLAEA